MTDAPSASSPTPQMGGVRAWPEPKVTNPDIADPTGVPYLDCLIHRLLDAQQDINLHANEGMSQSLSDASALLDEVETALRTAALSPQVQAGETAHIEKSKWGIIDWKMEVERLNRLLNVAQRPSNCDCGFSAEVCKTSPCMRKKMATSGLNSDAKYPYCGTESAAQAVLDPTAKGPDDCAEYILLQARQKGQEQWTNIYAAQLGQFIGHGCEVRALALPSTSRTCPDCGMREACDDECPNAPLSSTQEKSP